MTELREYQQELLEKAESSLAPAKAQVMLQLPTGGGKTHIAGALLKRWLHSGRKAVWLTHRTELADQTCRMLAGAGVSAITLKTWQSGEEAPSVPNGVVVLMAQTVGRRTKRMEIWGKYRGGDLLIIDEAHHATADGWERAIEQWPGRVIGLTATPWRLSKTEGFDHIFSELLHGPQICELQTSGWLCRTRVLVPRPGEVILGGSLNSVGEYSESGVEEANKDRPDILTAGALRFWKFHAAERKTVVYAISQDHGRNLASVFNEAGIQAAVLLSDTPRHERAKAIESFGEGSLRVLVNVAVATEGFDLPDASCIVITRPTMSLALYLQMVGRGLRPKANEGNCLILDLAGNAETHGLPEEFREWSLSPRGNESDGDAPVVRCEKCDAISPAASHSCSFCETWFGKDCIRCGTWRPWERWRYESNCGELHELVCDLCHYDAHLQAQLPLTDEIRALIQSENIEDNDFVVDQDPELSAAVRNLLEQERRRTSRADEERKSQLRLLIDAREIELNSDSLIQLFKGHLAGLPDNVRPKSELDEYRMFPNWEEGLKGELADWKGELSKLESKAPDRKLIFSQARERVLKVLEDQARESGLLPESRSPGAAPPRRQSTQNSGSSAADLGGWVSLVQVEEQSQSGQVRLSSFKPHLLRDSSGSEISVANWSDTLLKVAQWLVDRGDLSDSSCPVSVGEMGKRYLIHTEPVHSDGNGFGWGRPLSNGLYLEGKWDPKSNVRRGVQLLAKFGYDPVQFCVFVNPGNP